LAVKNKFLDFMKPRKKRQKISKKNLNSMYKKQRVPKLSISSYLW